MNPKQPIDNDERIEGLVAEGETLSMTLDLTDREVANIIGDRVTLAEKWWNDKLDLDKVRETNEKYYLNNPYDTDDLYDFQVPYKNNRIITAIETLIPIVIAQPAQPVVTEAQDTDASRQLAQDMQSVLLAKYEDLYLKAKLARVVRHILMGKRVGILKYRFDPNIGKLKDDGSRRGGIVVEVVRPEKVVFDREAMNPDDISLIAEYLTATIEELIIKFPDKKEDIFRKFGIIQGRRSQLQRIVGYLEVWFSYYNKEGKKAEAVAWKIDDVILDKIKNPNWNYDEYKIDGEKGVIDLNFFSAPQKPYILFNQLNTGKYVLDDTSLIEQAIPMQDILNKRGRQIVENADQAGSGRVVNSQLVKPEDVAKLVNDPSEVLMVDGPVGQAVTRMETTQLPSYVIQDKYDARGEVDNMFGANAPMRGESSGLQTLGQDVLSQRANSGRLQTLTDVVEDGMDRLYKAFIQMMKVYMDDPEVIRFRQSDGKTKFIEWSRDKIEDGIQIRVKAGSVMPKDKFQEKNDAMQLAALLDPLTLGEKLNEEDPKEFARRMTNYRYSMDAYMATIGDETTETNPQAVDDIQAIIGGQNPDIPDAPSKNYLFTLQKYVTGNGFKNLADQEAKSRIYTFMMAVLEAAKKGIGEVPTEQPPETPMDPSQEPMMPPEPGAEQVPEATAPDVTGQGIVATEAPTIPAPVAPKKGISGLLARFVKQK